MGDGPYAFSFSADCFKLANCLSLFPRLGFHIKRAETDVLRMFQTAAFAKMCASVGLGHLPTPEPAERSERLRAGKNMR